MRVRREIYEAALLRINSYPDISIEIEAGPSHIRDYIPKRPNSNCTSSKCTSKKFFFCLKKGLIYIMKKNRRYKKMYFRCTSKVHQFVPPVPQYK